MLGKTVLFQAGTDHAGISCQSVVEKMLWKERKVTRHDLGREKFVEEVFAWKEKYGNRIHNQFERLGASFDWDRVTFTMDPVSFIVSSLYLYTFVSYALHETPRDHLLLSVKTLFVFTAMVSFTVLTVLSTGVSNSTPPFPTWKSKTKKLLVTP